MWLLHTRYISDYFFSCSSSKYQNFELENQLFCISVRNRKKIKPINGGSDIWSLLFGLFYLREREKRYIRYIHRSIQVNLFFFEKNKKKFTFSIHIREQYEFFYLFEWITQGHHDSHTKVITFIWWSFLFFFICDLSAWILNNSLYI